MAGLGTARALLARWRCWWRWPPGHAYERVDYVDPLSGRWAARARCVACGHESGLAEKVGFGPPRARCAGFVVETPEGAAVGIRYVPVTFAFGLRRRVFCVSLVDEGAPAALSEDLHVALGRALGLEADDPWIARTSRELAGELTQQP